MNNYDSSNSNINYPCSPELRKVRKVNMTGDEKIAALELWREVRSPPSWIFKDDWNDCKEYNEWVEKLSGKILEIELYPTWISGNEIIDECKNKAKLLGDAIREHVLLNN